ncbi:MAG TPA: dienelactone hydrolase family protein, partial [Gammaproteobacteria bacterium]|nr:dienelactone hydrolase family protein [Gammaproteobacteria bacterium]
STQPATPPASVAATVAGREHDAPTPPAQEPPKTLLLEQEVAYGEAQKRNLVGFLAMPQDAVEPLPGIIVIHEWWGLNDNIKSMTRRLAGEGYVVLAVDLYGGSTADTPEKARKLMAAVLSDADAGRANLKQAYNYLAKYAFAPRIGSIGWGFGGGWALQTALMLPDDVDAMVMYCGEVEMSEPELATLNMPLLGFFAGLDESIPARDVVRFRQTLLKLGKPVEMIIYPNVKRDFADPSSGEYDDKAATEAWVKTLAFLAENLKPKPH